MTWHSGIKQGRCGEEVMLIKCKEVQLLNKGIEHKR